MSQQDEYLVDAILCHKDLAEQGQALALAHDTIRIALKTAGYENVDSMTQFERASALLNMAQELAALTDKRHATMSRKSDGFRYMPKPRRIDDYLYSHKEITA